MRIRSTELPKQYFDIIRRDDGLVDVFIVTDCKIYDIGGGKKEYDIDCFTLPAITPFPDMEQNIREHFRAWAAHAEAFTREVEAIYTVIFKEGCHRNGNHDIYKSDI